MNDCFFEGHPYTKRVARPNAFLLAGIRPHPRLETLGRTEFVVSRGVRQSSHHLHNVKPTRVRPLGELNILQSLKNPDPGEPTLRYCELPPQR